MQIRFINHHKETNDLYELMKFRRTTRRFSDKSVESEKLQRILQAGLYAPSGSNKSPFLITVITNREIRRRIRELAEAVERDFYDKKRQGNAEEFINWANEKNIKAVKPFLTEAPLLISVCEDTRWSDRHSKESTWLSIAYMVLAIANEGLNTVTYTPEPQDFMVKLLGLDDHFRSQVILPVGYSLTIDRQEPNRPDINERVRFIS